MSPHDSLPRRPRQGDPRRPPLFDPHAARPPTPPPSLAPILPCHPPTPAPPQSHPLTPLSTPPPPLAPPLPTRRRRDPSAHPRAPRGTHTPPPPRQQPPHPSADPPPPPPNPTCSCWLLCFPTSRPFGPSRMQFFTFFFSFIASLGVAEFFF